MTRFAWLFAVGLIVLACGLSLALYPQMPDRVPIHWNIHGKVDGYGQKAWAVFLMPATMAIMVALFASIPWLSPRKFEVDSFRATYLFVMVAVVALFGYMHVLMLYAAAYASDVSRPLVGGIFLFMALLGNVLGKVRPNFYIGVRTPWTLASERVWTDTHRLAAWLFVASGLLGFLLVLIGQLVAAFVLLMAAALVTVLYSLWRYKVLERRAEL